MHENLLIVFVKNPILGKVKTRLAKTMGDQTALRIYEFLTTYTRSITQEIDADKIVYYDQFIPEKDEWGKSNFRKELQQGKDLGERLKNAFELGFRDGYKRIVLIGSDCLDIKKETIENGFKLLQDYDVVVGPANDGGYYLVGTKSFSPELFEDMPWSTKNLLEETYKKAHALKLYVGLLELLSDIDEEKDLMNVNLDNLNF